MLYLVSDGDPAIACDLQAVYGLKVPRQLRYCHLLQEYRRNIGWDGWEEVKSRCPPGVSRKAGNG